jgi:hypothetical protein
VGPLQRICAHDESIHSYGVGDPRRVATRAGGKLLRLGVVPGRRGETGLAARIEETHREERQGSGTRQGQTTTKEESQEKLSDHGTHVATVIS